MYEARIARAVHAAGLPVPVAGLSIRAVGDVAEVNGRPGLIYKPVGEREHRVWYPIVAAARMSEGIAEIEDWLRGQLEAALG